MYVRHLAEALQLPFEGDGEKSVTAAAPIETAGAEELTFAGNLKALDHIAHCAAACIIVPADYTNDARRTVIRSPNPRQAFAQAVGILYDKPWELPSVHPSAVIGDGAEVPPTCLIGANVVIGAGSRIGSHTRILAGCVIGARVNIGHHCLLHPRVTIYDDVDIGHRAILHSGCVIGADGFGFVFTGERYEKFPQVGRVSIGDDVEIGANTCIDRAALGATVIGDGVKLDNLVHIAHNCKIGRHVVIAAQTGLSGGVVVGDYAVIGGQVGIGDKARIESRATLGSGCGVLTSKIVRSGQTVWGTPARPLKEYLHQLAAASRLPEELAEIKRRLEALEKE